MKKKANMVRLEIKVSPTQMARLRQLAKQELNGVKLSIAGYVRHAITNYLEPR